MRVKPRVQRHGAPYGRPQKTYPNPKIQRRGAKPLAASRARFAQVDPAIVFNDVLPDLTESNDGFAWACCPFHDDNRPSFSVNLHTGWYRCFSTSCGEHGSNIVSFVGALLGFEPAEARSYLGAHYG